jgi:hypothetical protein
VSRLRWLRFRLWTCVTRPVRGDGPVRAANPVERAVERRERLPLSQVQDPRRQRILPRDIGDDEHFARRGDHARRFLEQDQDP